MRLTALVYHDVLVDGESDDSGFAGADALFYKLTETQFHRHLNLIAMALGLGAPLCVADPARRQRRAARSSSPSTTAVRVLRNGSCLPFASVAGARISS